MPYKLHGVVPFGLVDSDDLQSKWLDQILNEIEAGTSPELIVGALSTPAGGAAVGGASMTKARGTVARELNDSLLISPMDTGGNDDLSANNNAALVALANAGGIVDPRIYRLDTSLAIPADKSLRGLGRQSLLQLVSSPGGGTGLLTPASGAEISALGLDLMAATAALRGVRINGVTDVTLRDLHIKSKRTGLYSVLLSGNNKRIKLLGLDLHTGAVGVMIKPEIDGGTGTVENVLIQGLSCIGEPEFSGTLATGGASSCTLPTGAASTDDYYNNFGMLITGGTGAGQRNLITDYTGSTRVCSFSTAWATAPSSDSTFEIYSTTIGVSIDAQTSPNFIRDFVLDGFTIDKFFAAPAGQGFGLGVAGCSNVSDDTADEGVIGACFSNGTITRIAGEAVHLEQKVRNVSFKNMSIRDAKRGYDFVNDGVPRNIRVSGGYARDLDYHGFRSSGNGHTEGLTVEDYAFDDWGRLSASPAISIQGGSTIATLIENNRIGISKQGAGDAIEYTGSKGVIRGNIIGSGTGFGCTGYAIVGHASNGTDVLIESGQVLSGAPGVAGALFDLTKTSGWRGDKNTWTDPIDVTSAAGAHVLLAARWAGFITRMQVEWIVGMTSGGSGSLSVGISGTDAKHSTFSLASAGSAGTATTMSLSSTWAARAFAAGDVIRVKVTSNANAGTLRVKMEYFDWR